MQDLIQSERILFSRDQYRTLLEVAESIASHRDLSDLFHDMAERLPRIVPFDYINLVLHDPARNVMRLNLLVAPDTSTILPGLELPVDDSPGGLVWLTQEPLIVEDVTLENRFGSLVPRLIENNVQSFCVVPLTTAFRRLGAMGFGSRQKRNYRESDVAFMQHVAKQVAVAVDNVLHDESAQAAQQQLARERDRVQLLLEVNNAVVSHLDLEELFTAVSGCLRKVIDHDGASLLLIDQRTGLYRVHVLLFAKNQSFVEEGLTASACTAPASVAIANRKSAVFSEQDLKNLCVDAPGTQKLLDEGVKAFCSVPLASHERILGALNIGRRHDILFSPEDVDLLGEVSKQIAIAVENAQAYQELRELKDKLAKEKLYLEEEVRTDHNFEDIVGESPVLRRVLKEVEKVASTTSTVLVRGETGTGKELIARALHDLSPRRERTFVKLNCAAIPTGLLESELFGHEKGAFTGAIMSKVGRFELAHGGTLFLDEVGDIPLELQPKLLRALQEQEFERLGSTQTIRVDVRLVAATNRDLARMVVEGKFRSDLYYRLNVFPVVLPPLRERRDDIPMLARHFTQRFARRMGRLIETIPADVMESLVAYSWPGNVREMQNVIERAVILSSGTALQIPVGELQPVIEAANHRTDTVVTLADAEREHILEALRASNWTLGGPHGAANRLAMKRTTLQSRMKKLGIARPR